MRTYVDPRYLDERERFKLMATCEFCEHFSHGDKKCSLGFPNDMHREAAHQAALDGDAVLFCKYFSPE